MLPRLKVDWLGFTFWLLIMMAVVVLIGALEGG
jgi:hypothetical protein